MNTISTQPIKISLFECDGVNKNVLKKYFNTDDVDNIIQGHQFKKIYNSRQFCRILPKSGKNNGFQYKEGNNISPYAPGVDTNELYNTEMKEINVLRIMSGIAQFSQPPFHPDNNDIWNGLYFIEESNISSNFAYEPKYKDCDIYKVDIMDDSIVCIEDGYFKTDKFILSNKTTLKTASIWNDVEFCKSIVHNSPNVLQLIDKKFQTKEICEEAVQNNGNSILFVRNDLLTEKLYEMAVQNDGGSIRYINKSCHTEKLCELAVHENGIALQQIDKDCQTYNICKIAVKNKSSALSDVNEKFLTEELHLIAVKKCGIQLSNISEQMQTLKVCMEAVKTDPGAIRYIKSWAMYLKVRAKTMF